MTEPTKDDLKREIKHYRILLEQIAGDHRNTRGKLLAQSGLTFWDALMEEKRKRGAKV